ncbi:MAG: energy-coupling factor transporter transmembrane component T [bacterium]
MLVEKWKGGITIYLYLDKQTVIHDLNPITKIISLLLLFALSLVFNNPMYLLFLLGFTLLIGYKSKSLENIVRIRVLLICLVVMCPVLWTFFIKGKTILWQYKFLSVSKESLLYGLGMSFRLAMMIISGMIFISCTKVEEFTWGLQKLGLPFRVSFALSLAFRLVPTFAQTAQTITQSQLARGLDLDKGGFIVKIKKYIPVIIPILAYAIRKTDLLAQALESKGFGTKGPRTHYLEFKVFIVDYLVVGLLICLLVFSILVRLSGFGIVIDRL